MSSGSRHLFTRFLTRRITPGLLAVAVMSFGCGGGGSPAAPTQQPPPQPPPTVVTPSIAAISPTRGSTGGGTTLRITGSGFQLGALASFDAEPGGAVVENSTTIWVTTPSHGTGPVDVVVTNPTGQVARLAGGFTYASPQSFDFNGTWDGFALAHPEGGADVRPLHSDMPLRFTVLNNQLASFTCDSATLTFSPPLSVTNGEFSFTGADGVAVSGRIVSDGGTLGKINTTACPATRWFASRP